MIRTITIISTLCMLMPLQSAFAAKYARFSYQGETHYGRVSGDQLLILEGGLFPLSATSDQTVHKDEVEYLPPTEASKVFAVGMNFASHLSSRADAPPPLFLKLPSSLTGHNRPVILPDGADNVHFEGEMVLVIGKQAKDVSEETAKDYIFGVTIGNDLSERTWQRRDLQWLRAKASDGFGPVGPVIATDITYNDILLTTRVNGEVVQQESTANMIHSPEKVVSYLSRYFTLQAGDLIFMGTPGKTSALAGEDVVSVEIDGVGVLSNTIIR